jgi:hypothetical protein
LTTTAVARRGKPFVKGFYSMHSDEQLMDIAESTTLPTAMRLFMLASARSNYWGHAPFGRDDICSLLGINRRTRLNAINSLISGKVIAPESTNLCLVLSAAVVRRTDKAYQSCAEQKHADRQRRMWVAGIGWEAREGEWQAAVSNPATAAIVATRITRKRRIVEEEETIEQVGMPVAEWQLAWPNLTNLPQPWNPAAEDSVT